MACEDKVRPCGLAGDALQPSRVQKELYCTAAANKKSKERNVPEVLNAFVGEGPVEVTPRVLLVDESTGLQGLHRLDDHEVWDLSQFRVLRSVEVLLGDHHAVLLQVAGQGRSSHTHTANPQCAGLEGDICVH